MESLKTENVDKALGVAAPILAVLGVLYVFCMFIYPFYKGDWRYVHDVLNDWQSLNVGILAFIASVIAFYISRYHESGKREREFVAAKAFLPHALSELTGYCKSCSVVLREAYRCLNSDETRPKPISVAPLELPQGLNDTFSRCIASADRDVGAYLANILVKLQINHSRLRELQETFGRSSEQLWLPINVMSYVYSLGELQALVSNIFNFARSIEAFDSARPNWEDFRNAYGNLGIELDEIDDLEEFTKRAIARQG
jgi:hypothetical protein